MIELITLPIICLILLALLFDFTNGFHDAANSVATVIATGTLTIKQALLLSAACNFIVMFFITLSVAATVGKGIIVPTSITLNVIFAALSGAICWNIITWYFGLPTSSSHALIGGMVGATLISIGPSALVMDGIIKVLIFVVASPCIGFVLGAGINTIMRNALPIQSEKHEKVFRYGQILSSSFYSMGHGANDAQKTAGIIWLILIAGGVLSATASIPFWVVLVSFITMGLGTLAGGWRIIKTLGFKLTKLNKRDGFVAETGGGIMLFVASVLGIPVSTTHTITGSILGVGASSQTPKVKWKKAREILLAWIVTIPAAGILAAAFEYILTHI